MIFDYFSPVILGLMLNVYLVTVEVNKVFKSLSEQKLTFNINKSVFVTFSKTNVYIPIDDIVVHYYETNNILFYYRFNFWLELTLGNTCFGYKVSYTKNNFGEYFLEYLGPPSFNAMPLYLKKNMF